MRGIVTVLNTPFTRANKIDFLGLRKNVSAAVDAGVAGFLVPAMASEVSQLSPLEKREVVAQVVEQVDGQATVIGGAAANSQQNRLEIAGELIKLGCDGVLVPVDPLANLNTVERQLAEISELGPKFLMLQDWDPDGPGLDIPTIVELFERLERLRWLKIEVQNAGPKYTRVLEATGGQLGVAGGWAVTEMLDGLDRGVHVFMPTAMHEIYAEIYRRYASGNRPGAKALFAQIKPVLDFSNQHLEVSIRFFKRLLYAQGVYATDKVRIAGEPFNEDQLQVADELIRVVRAVENDLASSA